MTVRPDNRLESGAMSSVTCATCSGTVEARKSSWEQTSIQWHADAVHRCLERRAWSPRQGVRGGYFPGCASLRQALQEAAESGALPVQDEVALKTNLQAPEGIHNSAGMHHARPGIVGPEQ